MALYQREVYQRYINVNLFPEPARKSEKARKKPQKIIQHLPTIAIQSKTLFSEIKILPNYVYFQFEVFPFIRFGTLYCLVL